MRSLFSKDACGLSGIRDRDDFTTVDWKWENVTMNGRSGVECIACGDRQNPVKKTRWLKKTMCSPQPTKPTDGHKGTRAASLVT